MMSTVAHTHTHLCSVVPVHLVAVVDLGVVGGGHLDANHAAELPHRIWLGGTQCSMSHKDNGTVHVCVCVCQALTLKGVGVYFEKRYTLHSFCRNTAAAS